MLPELVGDRQSDFVKPNLPDRDRDWDSPRFWGLVPPAVLLWIAKLAPQSLSENQRTNNYTNFIKLCYY
ncbi:hypothetical protein [Microcoleus sp.]|uniref:hypothetical protein n=1 Tax=Microcoleus sp. TaxID=44472 RepID=UPI003C791C89